MWGVGCREKGVGCRVWGVGFKVTGVGCRVQGVGQIESNEHFSVLTRRERERGGRVGGEGGGESPRCAMYLCGAFTPDVHHTYGDNCKTRFLHKIPTFRWRGHVSQEFPCDTNPAGDLYRFNNPIFKILPFLASSSRKVDIRLPGKGNSNSHGARPIHHIYLKD